MEFFCRNTASPARTRLNCREVHPVAGARSDQARAAHMHLADGVCHLLDRAYFLDDEPVRQKPLINQLHHPLVSRVQPDRPEMLSANLHRLLLGPKLRVKKLKLRVLWSGLRLPDDTHKNGGQLIALLTARSAVVR